MEHILAIINRLEPISLEQMSGIKLMNRIDTKFVLSLDQLRQMLALAEGDYYIQEIGGKRLMRYHTIYLDTPGNHFYHVHHSGRLVREKIRMRTYVDSDLTFLEVKNKNNKKRTKKKRIELESMQKVDVTEAVHPFLAKHAWFGLGDLHRSLENRFERLTLVNMAKTERLTIDTNIRFFNPVNEGTYHLDGIAIVEVKRDGLVHSPVMDILRRLRLLPTGFSKYCMGMALTDPTLKQNRFKPRLRKVVRLQEWQRRLYAAEATL